MVVKMRSNMSTTEAAHTHDQIDFYRLSRKFIDDKEIPDEAQHIIYYSLGIGHHLGVVDCLQSEMSCSEEEYHQWISGLPEESEAYRKMHGYFVFGEISIFPEHIHMLACAFDEIDTPTQSQKSKTLTQGLIRILNGIYNEPNMYLMIRRTQRG